MIRFSLLGVPVGIHPTLWITLALLGGGFNIARVGDLLGVALFVVAGFICLLAHEMGHALVGRRLGGGHPEIHLAWLGGDCTNMDARLTRTQGIVMTAAGPLASLSVGLLATLLLGVYVGDLSVGGVLALNFMWGRLPMELLEGYPAMAIYFFVFTIEISFWWTVLNLLPVFPLDGGQIMQGLMRSPRLMHTISFSAALVLTLFFLVLGAWLMCFLMGVLAVFNYRMLRQCPY